MDPWQRAIAFLRAVDERGAEEVRPFEWGRALINRRFNLVHDANYLLVDHVDEATAGDLIAAAEEIQASLGLQHRRINLDDREAADRIEADFQARGYTPERFLLMVHARDPDRIVNVSAVREVPWDEVRLARRLEREQAVWAYPQLIDQMLARDELLASRVSTRYFAALADGQVVASCELRTEAGTAQIETVETLPEYRNRGLARAVVSAALMAANGSDFIFLVTDQNDWPRHLYRSLGFNEVGIESRFLHLLDT